MTTQPPSDSRELWVRRDRPSALNDPASRDQEVRTVEGDRRVRRDLDFLTDLTTLGNGSTSPSPAPVPPSGPWSTCCTQST
jgi:hypothetical protein